MKEINIDSFKVIEKAIASKITRKVTFLIVPILLPLTGAVALWLQKTIGLNLDGAEIASYLVTAIFGLAFTIGKWVEGRYHFEAKAAEVVGQIDVGSIHKLFVELQKAVEEAQKTKE